MSAKGWASPVQMSHGGCAQSASCSMASKASSFGKSQTHLRTMLAPRRQKATIKRRPRHRSVLLASARRWRLRLTAATKIPPKSGWRRAKLVTTTGMNRTPWSWDLRSLSRLPDSAQSLPTPPADGAVFVRSTADSGVGWEAVCWSEGGRTGRLDQVRPNPRMPGWLRKPATVFRVPAILELLERSTPTLHDSATPSRKPFFHTLCGAEPAPSA